MLISVWDCCPTRIPAVRSKVSVSHCFPSLRSESVSFGRHQVKVPAGLTVIKTILTSSSVALDFVSDPDHFGQTLRQITMSTRTLLITDWWTFKFAFDSRGTSRRNCKAFSLAPLPAIIVTNTEYCEDFIYISSAQTELPSEERKQQNSVLAQMPLLPIRRRHRESRPELVKHIINIFLGIYKV